MSFGIKLAKRDMPNNWLLIVDVRQNQGTPHNCGLPLSEPEKGAVKAKPHNPTCRVGPEIKPSAKEHRFLHINNEEQALFPARKSAKSESLLRHLGVCFVEGTLFPVGLKGEQKGTTIWLAPPDPSHTPIW